MIKYKTIDIYGLWNKVEERRFNQGNLIFRFKLSEIINRINKDFIEVITGPRQSGKTTFLFMIINKLILSNINSENIYYINLDTIVEMEQFENPLLFIKNINNKGDKGKKYIFIDEVQRIKKPGIFLKGIYDLDKNIKLFVTGSSSIEIKSKIKEYLTGRKREINLLPISFTEYINNEKKINIDKVKLKNETIKIWIENEKIFGKYLMNEMENTLIYGNYPAVLMEKNINLKIEELSEIYNSYINRDIINFMNVEKTEIFNSLIKILSFQIGNLINKTKICSLIGSNVITINKYMNILKETYITYYLPPFLSKKRNEIKRSHKCFFIDNGIRNFSIRNFNKIENRNDKGALYENLIFNELLKNISIQEELFFWRTKAGAEVDFIIKYQDNIIPIEIKSGSCIQGKLTKSFHSFLNYYKPNIAILLNKDLFSIVKINKSQLYYIPIHWFLLYGLDLIFLKNN